MDRLDFSRAAFAAQRPTLYAEAEQRLSEQGGAPEVSPGNTQAEAAAVAERYGYGELVQTITLDAPTRTFVLALVLVVVPALLGTVLLFQSDGGTSSRVGGIVLYVVAAAAIFGVNGFLDPYAWPDLELYQSVVTSTVGSAQREVSTDLLLIGPRGRSKTFVVPSLHHETVTDLARAGGAAISQSTTSRGAARFTKTGGSTRWRAQG
jgi:hypothetical protein